MPRDARDPMRVCIISPGALGSNPRIVKEAEALCDRGFEVEVVCTRTLAAVDARDADVLASARWRAHRIDLTDRTAWRMRRAGQAAAAWAFRLTGGRSLAETGLSAFTAPLAREAAAIAADLYIAHYPPALPAAAAAAALHGARYAFDAEDFHLGDLAPGPEADRTNRILRRVESSRLPGCAFVTAASPGIADAYAEAYGIARPTVVLNVFPRAAAPSGPSDAGSAVGPSVYWFSQVVGPDRGLETAIAAVSRARSRPHLYLRGMISDGYAAALDSLAATLGVRDRLHILPPASPSEMEREAAPYDVGLVAETGHTQNRRIALTNKQFSYLLAGLPSILSDIPAHRAIAADLGAAARLFAVDDPDSLALVLDEVLGDPIVLAGARRAAFELGQSRYNWDVERDSFLRCVETVRS